MTKVSRGLVVLATLALLPLGLEAQEREDPIPSGLYRFVPEQSEEIDGKIRDAVSHMNFLVRQIAKGRLAGANRPIHQVDIRYQGDSVWISLREDEPWVVSLRSGEEMPYTRADGEVVQVKTDLSPGVIDQYFTSEDGEKQMIYRLRDDGMLEVESITYSDKLEEPFRYTWVYERVPRDEAGGDSGG